MSCHNVRPSVSIFSMQLRISFNGFDSYYLNSNFFNHLLPIRFFNCFPCSLQFASFIKYISSKVEYAKGFIDGQLTLTSLKLQPKDSGNALRVSCTSFVHTFTLFLLVLLQLVRNLLLRNTSTLTPSTFPLLLVSSPAACLFPLGPAGFPDVCPLPSCLGLSHVRLLVVSGCLPFLFTLLSRSDPTLSQLLTLCKLIQGMHSLWEVLSADTLSLLGKLSMPSQLWGSTPSEITSCTFPNLSHSLNWSWLSSFAWSFSFHLCFFYSSFICDSENGCDLVEFAWFPVCFSCHWGHTDDRAVLYSSAVIWLPHLHGLLPWSPLNMTLVYSLSFPLFSCLISMKSSHSVLYHRNHLIPHVTIQLKKSA